MLTVKNIENNTMYNMQELHLSLFLPTIFTFSIIIEIKIRIVVLNKLDKTINPVKTIFLINLNIFYTIVYYFSSSNTYECLRYHQQQ